ncbi:MAG TPA: ABC transporter permease [Planctomycetota bacterium]|nr:ABC transporter permease [Planctomycetota bacterium]
MYAGRLAWRYLFARWIHVVGIFGIAVGVTALVVVLSVMNGFIQETRRMARGSLADVIVTPRPRDGETLPPYAAYEKVIRSTPGVGACAPRFVHVALISTGPTTNLLRTSASLGARNAVTLVGLDPPAEKGVTSLGEALRNPPLGGILEDSRVPDPENPFAPPLDALPPVDREAPPRSVVVGEQLYRNLRLYRGQMIDLATATWSAAGNKVRPINRRFAVAGTFRTGEYEYDLSTILLPRVVLARDFLEGEEDFSEIVVRVEDPKRADAAAERLGERLAEAGLPGTTAEDDAHGSVPLAEVRDGPGGSVHERKKGPSCGRPVRRQFLYVETWEERKRILLGAIDNERRIMAVILFFIVIVAAILLFALLTTTVKEKTRDIGILMALGASRAGILSIFLGVGLVITLLGEALGLAAGLAITSNLSEIERFLRERVGLVIFRPDIYIFDHLPCEVDPAGVALILLFTSLAALLFTSIPAWVAGRKDPVEALRYE